MCNKDLQNSLCKQALKKQMIDIFSPTDTKIANGRIRDAKLP